MSKEMIDVCCCVFPDGTTFWTDDLQGGPRNATTAWKATLSDAHRAELMESGSTLGAVVVRMPLDAYNAIQVCNSPITVAYIAQRESNRRPKVGIE